MNIDKERTGQLIAKRRKLLHMTQNDLAEKLHISAKAISKWERAQTFPNIDVLSDLADALQLNVDDLIVGNHIESFEFMNNRDWSGLYLKNCCYTKYLRIMELVDVDEEIILNCIFYDYYRNFKEEIDEVYKNQCKDALMYGQAYKNKQQDIYLCIQNGFNIANNIINRGPISIDAIDEANFNVFFLEYDIATLIYSNAYNVRYLTQEQSEKYDKFLKYMIIRCDMKDCIRVFNVLDDTRAYKRALSIIHSNYFDTIEQYFDDDLLSVNGKHIFADDFDINELIWKFKESLCIVDYEILKSLNCSEFVDKEILKSMNKMGLWAAILSKLNMKY